MSMRKIYRQIARKHGVSIGEVKRDMEAAIANTYRNPNAAARSVQRKKDTPTPEELIAHIVDRVRSTINDESSQGG